MRLLPIFLVFLRGGECSEVVPGTGGGGIEVQMEVEQRDGTHALPPGAVTSGNENRPQGTMIGMRAPGLDSTQATAQMGMYTVGLMACEREAMWEKSLDLLAKMKGTVSVPSMRLWNMVLNALSRGSQWQRVLSLKEEMTKTGVFSNHNTFIIIFKTLSSISSHKAPNIWTHCVRLVKEMEDKGLTGDISTLAAAVQVMRHFDKEAYAKPLMSKIFQLFKAQIVGFESYYPHGRLGNRAIELIYQMQERSVKPSVEMVNIAIVSCARTYAWSRVLEILDVVQGRRVKFNVLTYNAGLAAMRKGIRWEVASDLLSMMNEDGIPPDETTLSVAMAIFREAAREGYTASSETLCNLEGVTDLVAKYQTAFHFTLSRHPPSPSRWEKALAIMARLQRKSLPLGPEMFTRLVGEAGKAQNWQVMLSAVASMAKREFYIGDDVYNAVLEALRDNKKWEIALNVFKTMHQMEMEPGFVTDGLMREVLEASDRIDMVDHLLDQNMLRTLTYRLPNGRFNIFEIDKTRQPDSKTGKLENFRWIRRGVYKYGPYILKVAGLNVPPNSIDQFERSVPTGTRVNMSFDTGFTILQRENESEVIGDHNETALFNSLKTEYETFLQNYLGVESSGLLPDFQDDRDENIIEDGYAGKLEEEIIAEATKRNRTAASPNLINEQDDGIEEYDGGLEDLENEDDRGADKGLWDQGPEDS
ncbi:hypothetical protein AAMO2058_000355500 [Amorphochlora amoebiformis]